MSRALQFFCVLETALSCSKTVEQPEPLLIAVLMNSTCQGQEAVLAQLCDRLGTVLLQIVNSVMGYRVCYPLDEAAFRSLTDFKEMKLQKYCGVVIKYAMWG